jgi:hypothetical protein
VADEEREHLGETFDEDAALDPVEGFELWREAARSGRLRCREHQTPPVPRLQRAWARWAYEWFADPDGRPRALKRRGAF